MSGIKSSLWLAVFLGIAASSVAPVAAYADGGIITVLDENDTYVNTDRYYTNGVKFGYTTRPSYTDFARNVAEQACVAGR